MASVWRARHASTRRVGAVKLIPPAGRDARWTVDLLNEARILAAVDHPHVIDILDYGIAETSVGHVPGGSVWIATELAEGSLVGQKMDWDLLRDVLLQTLDGLARAHAVGIVHRDIKPGNLLQFHSRQGTMWKLADFGLALRSGTDAKGVAGGTPGFMAPEQITGAALRPGAVDRPVRAGLHGLVAGDRPRSARRSQGLGHAQVPPAGLPAAVRPDLLGPPPVRAVAPAPPATPAGSADPTGGRRHRAAERGGLRTDARGGFGRVDRVGRSGDRRDPDARDNGVL